MRVLKTSSNLCRAIILALAAVGAACQEAPVANTNVNTANTTTATPAVNTNTAPATTSTGPAIEAREPEEYRATLVFTAETTGGERAMAIPTLSAEVARRGADRRYAFKLPSGEQLIYLDRADKRYIISPSRKQYAELTPEATGFEVPRAMTPGQIVEQLKKQSGYERVGEEQLNGREVVKYRYASTARTGTQAGDVKAETFVYVDKETGLPLRSEIFSEATGSVQGVKGVKIIQEMRDIQRDVDASLFEVPPGLKQVTPEQVRQQIDALASIAGAILRNMTMPQSGGGSGSGSGGSASGATPNASSSPALTASPSPTAR